MMRTFDGATGLRPVWVTDTGEPAMVSVAVRGPAVFAAAEKATVPLPDPAAPDVTVNQLVSLELAVQAHPACVVTATLPVPPAVGSD
jgi:hypothetical protein